MCRIHPLGWKRPLLKYEKMCMQLVQKFTRPSANDTIVSKLGPKRKIDHPINSLDFFESGFEENIKSKSRKSELMHWNLPLSY